MILNELTERDAGSATGMGKGGKTFALMDLASQFSDAETEEDMYARLAQAAEKLRALSGNVLAVSHNGTIKVMRAVIAGLPAGDFRKMPDLHNGEMFIWETEEK